MSSKSAVKLVAPADAPDALFRWVAVLTGSKNALKGVGLLPRRPAADGRRVPARAGRADGARARRRSSSCSRSCAASSARPTHGEVRARCSPTTAPSTCSPRRGCSCSPRATSGSSSACPVFLRSRARLELLAGRRVPRGLGDRLRHRAGVGAAASRGGAPAARGARPAARPPPCWRSCSRRSRPRSRSRCTPDVDPTAVVVAGLVAFGVVFALNSAVHSYLILAYADRRPGRDERRLLLHGERRRAPRRAPCSRACSTSGRGSRRACGRRPRSCSSPALLSLLLPPPRRAARARVAARWSRWPRVDGRRRCPVSTLKKVVLRDQVKEFILERILTGAYAPGQRLVETQIARELECSQAPVREALRDLEQLGCVHYEPNRGLLGARVLRGGSRQSCIRCGRCSRRWRRGGASARQRAQQGAPARPDQGSHPRAHRDRARTRPAQRLVETQIARELECSQAPVREALRDLEQLGCVHYEPNRGCSVRAFSEAGAARGLPGARRARGAGGRAGRLAHHRRRSSPSSTRCSRRCATAPSARTTTTRRAPTWRSTAASCRRPATGRCSASGRCSSRSRAPTSRSRSRTSTGARSPSATARSSRHCTRAIRGRRRRRCGRICWRPEAAQSEDALGARPQRAS